MTSHDPIPTLIAPSPADGRMASMSLASVLAIGCFYLVAAPQPDNEDKLGATRPTAVASRMAENTTGPSDSTVKVIGAAADATKSCDEQTWPYIEQRCLTLADGKPRKDDNTHSTPLGIRDILTGISPAPAHDASSTVAKTEPAAAQPVGSTTAITPTPPVTEMQANTVAANAATSGASAGADGVAHADEIDVPLPQPRPDLALADLSEPADAVAHEPGIAPPPLSRAEQRRMDREERRMQREARRAHENPNRVVRRWSEYSYRGDDGDPRRLVVIHHGSRLDRFFRNFR